MNGFGLFFVALTLLNAWRFHKTRNPWFLALCLLFGLAAVRERLPETIFTTVLVALLIWLVWLAAWRFIPSLRFRRLMGNPKLAALTSDDRKWRATLGADERSSLEMWEMLLEKRLSMPEAMSRLESIREVQSASKASEAARSAEEEAERAVQSAIDAEERDLMIAAFPSPLEVVLQDHSRSWLKLDVIEGTDEEDAYSAPVNFTVWSGKPSASNPGDSTVLSLGQAIEFQEVATTGNEAAFWASSSPEFKEMFRHRCLISGVNMADDGRERFTCRIGDKEFVIMTKYLFWHTDLALDEDQQRVWVRISGMMSEVWSGDLDAEGDASPEFEDFERIPAFVFPVPVDRLMPSGNPDAHYATLEEMFE